MTDIDYERIATAFERIGYDEDFDLSGLVRALADVTAQEPQGIWMPWPTIQALADRILEQQDIITQTALIQELPIDPQTGGLIE
jgi:hypothetical protein